MNVRQDRILRVLREFCKDLTNSPFSYALLNINEVAKTKIPYEKWEDVLSETIRGTLNKALKDKDQELRNMNVRVIWYSAPEGSLDGHESAKRQLFKYILDETREKTEKEKFEKQRSEEEKAKNEAAAKKQEMERLQTQFDNILRGEGADNYAITTPKKGVNENFFSEEEIKQSGSPRSKLEDFLRSKIRVMEARPNKWAIAMPMYKVGGGLYEIYLVRDQSGFYLSDEGTTYSELDKVFELKEPDVIKNLVAILKQYRCRKQVDTNAFTIECNPEDIHIKMSYLIQALSFMLNMKIFYV